MMNGFSVFGRFALQSTSTKWFTRNDIITLSSSFVVRGFCTQTLTGPQKYALRNELNKKMGNAVENRDYEEAFRIATEMKSSQISPDSITLQTLQMVYFKLFQFEQVFQCFSEAIQLRIPIQRSLINNCIRAASELNDLQRAKQFLTFLEDGTFNTTPNASSYDFFLKCCESGYSKDAWEAFRSMQRKKIPPSEFTFSRMAFSFANGNDWVRLEVLLDIMKENRVKLEPKAFASVLRLGFESSSEKILNHLLFEVENNTAVQLKFSALKYMCSVFGERGDIDGLNLCLKRAVAMGLDLGGAYKISLLEANARRRNLKETLTLLCECVNDGALIRTDLFGTIITCCGTSVEVIDQAYYILLEMHQSGKTVPVQALNVILNACARKCDVERAFATFAELKSVFKCTPSVQSYNILIDSCSIAGQTSSAFRVYEEMKKNNIQPNNSTFSFLLLACVRDEDLDRSLAILNSVRENEELRPGAPIYIILIRKAARLGNQQLLSEFMKLHEKDHGPVPNDTKMYTKRGQVVYDSETFTSNYKDNSKLKYQKSQNQSSTPQQRKSLSQILSESSIVSQKTIF